MAVEIKNAHFDRADHEQNNNSTCIYKGQGLYAKCKDCIDPAGCKLYMPVGDRKPMRSIYTYQGRCQNYWLRKFRKV